MCDFPNDHGYQVFRVFRVSYLLPNAKGEKYQFKGISANSWLSPIGHANERPLSSVCPYKPVRARPGSLRENIAILGTERKREPKLGKDEVLRGITLKSRVLLRDKSNRTQNMNMLPNAFSKRNEERLVRPRTCSGYTSRKSELKLQHNDLTVTVIALNQQGNSENVYRRDSDTGSCIHPTTTECRSISSETFKRLHSAPPEFKRMSSRRPSSTRRGKASSPSFWKTREHHSQFESGENNDELLRGPHLRSLLQRTNSEPKPCNTCPNKCKGFRACLASEEYFSKLKPESVGSLL